MNVHRAHRDDAVADVHRLAFGLFRIDVDNDDLRDKALRGNGKCNGRADRACTDNADLGRFSFHFFSCLCPYLIIVSLLYPPFRPRYIISPECRPVKGAKHKIRDFPPVFSGAVFRPFPALSGASGKDFRPTRRTCVRAARIATKPLFCAKRGLTFEGEERTISAEEFRRFL